MRKLALVLALTAALSAFAGCTTGGGAAPKYMDGTYRGAYFNPEDVEVEFVMKDGKFESIKYRQLGYKGESYLKSEDPVMKGVTEQYQALADHLVGKEPSALMDLYKPENIAKDTDTFTAATMRAGKMITAVQDGLNRGPYALPKG